MHRETEKRLQNSKCFHEPPSGLYLYPSGFWLEIAADLRPRCCFGTHALDEADDSAGSDADPLSYSLGAETDTPAA